MKKRTITDARRWLKSYMILRKELESRMEYIEEFKKILIRPLRNDEEKLKKIYNSTIEYMEGQAKMLKRRTEEIERVIGALDDLERSVLYHRYIKGISWIEMPEIILYEHRTCQNIETRALRKIVKMKINWEGTEIDEQED